jgi:hypothetical protein
MHLPPPPPPPPPPITHSRTRARAPQLSPGVLAARRCPNRCPRHRLHLAALAAPAALPVAAGVWLGPRRGQPGQLQCVAAARTPPHGHPSPLMQPLRPILKMQHAPHTQLRPAACCTACSVRRAAAGALHQHRRQRLQVCQLDERRQRRGARVPEAVQPPGLLQQRGPAVGGGAVLRGSGEPRAQRGTGRRGHPPNNTPTAPPSLPPAACPLPAAAGYQLPTSCPAQLPTPAFARPCCSPCPAGAALCRRSLRKHTPG